MTDYREILRLRGLGLNHSQIAESLSASRTTVIRVLQQAQVLELDWPAADGLSDKELANRLFPSEDGKPGYKIFCSQFEVGGWHQKIGEATLADAICDRIVHDSYTIVIGGADSMRKRKGIAEEA